MKNIASRLLHALSLASLVVASLGIAGVAGAAEEALPSLSYDQTGERLLKVDSHQLFQSMNAGATWKKMDSGPTQVIRRLVHSDMQGSMQTGWLYAVSDDAVRLSMDCFCGWRPTGELDAGRVYDVAYDLDDPERVYVSTEQGLWRSDNGGQEWQRANSGGTEKVALILAPAGTLYALDREGELMRSEDHGQTWTTPDA